ncbi:MAG: hypothetical protein JXB50_13585 [Spirochaetes bacterium]|nr:hypothetical protein [Spirochaetota bacterium]
MSNHIKFYLLFSILISCRIRSNFYDIEGPVLEFYKLNKESIFFQFNEPIKYLKLMTDEEKFIYNDFYTANLHIPYDFFLNLNNTSIKMVSVDTFDNKSETEIAMPIINNNPAKLIIKEARIKYSSKKSQQLIIKAIKGGSINGFRLMLFIKNNKIIIPFSDENLLKNQILEINVAREKNIQNINYNLSFKKKERVLIFQYRLSQIYSCIMILDNKDEIIDYLIYYDLKEHDKSYYLNNKFFNNYKNEILKRNIEPEIIDISEITLKKTIKKYNNNFIIN